MARITVFIDHDIVIRHFVMNGALLPLQDKHDVLFVFPDQHKRVQTDLAKLGLKRFKTIPTSQRRAYFYRRLYHATVLMNMRRTALSHRRATRRVWRKLLGIRGYWTSWLYSWPLTHRWYRAYMLKEIGEHTALNTLLEEERPDVILHPTVLEGLFVSDLVRYGQANKTPTVFIMNSWDNPATKAMMVGYPSQLVVWGEQTRQHAVQHLNMPPDRIVCLGAAQFDLYREPPKENAVEYRRRLGIPPHRKVLLYAGSSKGLNETSHLIRLDEAIERGDLKDTVILYRPHPWRSYPQDEADFCSLKWQHVLLDPSSEAFYRLSREATRMHVELANYENTHTVLSAVDAVISPLSTILLEAAMHGKPIAAYLPDEDIKTNTHLATVANMVHFEEFFERVDCIKCESPDHLIGDCRRLLQKTDEPGISDRLRKQCAYFVEPSDRPYADLVHELICSLVPGSAAGD